MKFRTEIDIPSFKEKISYRKPVIMMGSCFTDNIGNTLKELLFDVTINPFGVVYNPESLKKALDALLSKPNYKEEDLRQHKELWFSFDHYTKYSDPNKNKALDKINKVFIPAKEKLRSASTLLITFGTAWTYSLIESGEIVTNCHKIPAKEFERKLLTLSDIHQSYTQLIAKLRTKNPELQIIFTVSPVRHIKDGLIENQRSKATLLLAINEICNSFPECCSYFPAYEILMDDLRDYRFYDEDLVHPNNQAIKYIREIFEASLIDKESQAIIKEIRPLIQSLKHRPLHGNTEAYRKFQEKLNLKIDHLKLNYPSLSWDNISTKKILY